MKSLMTVQDFGAVDADNDPLLLDSFEDHEAYQDARQRTHFLIVGRKGSGKTAIFKILLETKEQGYFCFGHTFSDYPWQYHDKQARIGIPDFDKYTHSWKWGFRTMPISVPGPADHLFRDDGDPDSGLMPITRSGMIPISWSRSSERRS